MKFACNTKTCAKYGQWDGQEHDVRVAEVVFKNKTANQQGKLAPKCATCKKTMKLWAPQFAWNFSQGQQGDLDGEHDPHGVTNARPTTGTNEEAIYYYKGKHFRQENKNKGWGVYKSELNRVDVKRMEDYAILHGFGMEGERFFRFSDTVGYDGISGDTCSIRVDTGSSQHSHPVPERGGGIVSHDSKLKTTIMAYSENNDHEGLAEIARYLKIQNYSFNSIGLGFANVEQKKRFKQKGASVPASVYWNEVKPT